MNGCRNSPEKQSIADQCGRGCHVSDQLPISRFSLTIFVCLVYIFPSVIHSTIFIIPPPSYFVLLHSNLKVNFDIMVHLIRNEILQKKTALNTLQECLRYIAFRDHSMVRKKAALKVGLLT